MLLKQCDWPPSSHNCSIINDNSVFEMIILPELEYPLVCVGVSKSFGGNGLKLELINTNSGTKKSIFNEFHVHFFEPVYMTKIETFDIIMIETIKQKTSQVSCHLNFIVYEQKLHISHLKQRLRITIIKLIFVITYYC